MQIIQPPTRGSAARYCAPRFTRTLRKSLPSERPVATRYPSTVVTRRLINGIDSTAFEQIKKVNTEALPTVRRQTPHRAQRQAAVGYATKSPSLKH